MSTNNKKESVTYQVNGLSYSGLKAAQSATKNVSKELAKRFKETASSLSQFSNALASWDDATATNFKHFVLGLPETDLDDSGKVFKGIKSKYPFVNADGKLIKRRNVAKGFFVCEEITLFEESILDEIQNSWLTNRNQVVLPMYYQKTDNGVISECDKYTIDNAVIERTNIRDEKKVNAKAKDNLYAKLIEVGATLSGCKTKDDYINVSSKILEVIDAIKAVK